MVANSKKSRSPCSEEAKKEEKKDNMVFKIKSEDIPSMRAALNSLLKLFLIYEKMEEVE